MNTIYDPINGTAYSITSNEGTKLLKSFVLAYQNGGANDNNADVGGGGAVADEGGNENVGGGGAAAEDNEDADADIVFDVLDEYDGDNTTEFNNLSRNKKLQYLKNATDIIDEHLDNPINPENNDDVKKQEFLLHIDAELRGGFPPTDAMIAYIYKSILVD